MPFDETTYKALRKTWSDQLAVAQSDVKRYSELIRELDRSWSKLEVRNAEAGDKGGGSALTSRVKQCLDHLGDSFTTREAIETLVRIFPEYIDRRENVTFRANVAGALNALMKEELLERLSPGAGQRPATYGKRVESEGTASSN